MVFDAIILAQKNRPTLAVSQRSLSLLLLSVKLQELVR